MKCIEVKQYLDDYAGFDISQKSRESRYIKMRSMYYFLCMKYSSDGTSHTTIGLVLGRDHATVINGLKSFESFFLSDQGFKNSFLQIESVIVESLPKYTKKIITYIDSLDAEKLKGKLIQYSLRSKLQQAHISKLKKQIKLTA